MKFEVEEIGSVERRIHVEIPSEDLSKEMDEIFSELKGKVRLKGFRPGKAPRGILTQFYGKQVRKDAQEKLIKKSLPEALEKGDLEMVSEPVLEKEEVKEGGDFVYTARIEVKPRFELKDYMGLEIEKKEVKVTEDSIDKELESLRRKAAVFTNIDEDRPVRDGEFVVVDYDSKMEGGDRKADEGKGMVVEARSEGEEGELGKALVGLKVGDKTTFEYQYPSDYENGGLRGKKVEYHLKVKALKKQVLPELNDDFARDMDYKDMEELRKDLRIKTEKRMEERMRTMMKDQVKKSLQNDHLFDVPPSMLEKHLDYMTHEYLKIRYPGKGKEEIADEEVQRVKDELRQKAALDVRVGLVLERISKKESIDVEEDDIKGYFEKEAEGQRLTPHDIRSFYEKNNLMEGLKVRLRDEKTLDFLIKGAKIINKIQ